MEKQTTISVPVVIDTASKQKLHQAEDAINKLTVQYFGDEILPYLHIEGEIDHITQKLEKGEPLIKEDLVPLTLCPLMGGDIPQKERVLTAISIVKQAKNTVPDVDVIEAVIYAMANKFLNDVDMNEVKEAIKMSPLGTLIFNDGIIENATENARNFFKNGVSFEIVRDSITALPEETLKEIYDEVMASKQV